MKMDNPPKDTFVSEICTAASGAIIKRNSGSDVSVQLAQKENDLILAAELGKALLEKNEELKKHNDALSSDFGLKIEVRK